LLEEQAEPGVIGPVGRHHGLEESILWHVWDCQQCLREDLQHFFDVSAATISRVVGSLLDQGLLTETVVSSAERPGRKPRFLELNPKLTTLLGLEIDLDQVTAVVTTISGALLGRGRARCDARQGVAAILDPSEQAIGQALADAGVARQAIELVGVGHPGDLDHERGVCLFWAGAPAWAGAPLREILRTSLGMEVILDDHARAHALAQRRASPADRVHPNALYLLLEMGVGMGIFLGGRLYRGATRGGGEIGHTLIDPTGPLCDCGKRGCLQAYAGGAALLRYVAEQWPPESSSLLRRLAPRGPAQLTVELIASAARLGDSTARAAIERAANALGIAIANAVQLLNPSLVVLAGKLARAGAADLLNPVQETVHARCVPSAARTLEIRLAPAKKDISSVGCALIAAEVALQKAIHRTLFGHA
jgi:predicted NBD/HSP70 family sugar kinase